MAYTSSKMKVYNGGGSTTGYRYGVGTKNTTYDNTRGNITYGGVPKKTVTNNTKGTTPYTPGYSSKSGGTSGGSSSGSSSGGSSTYTKVDPQAYNPDVVWTDLIDVYMNNLNNRAQSAYNRSMGIINDYYDDAAQRLRDNYNASVERLDNNNANNTNAINADAEAAMRQAYVNNMLSRKSLQQAMTAQGLNGGATETTRASMENNYGNARNAIDTTRNKNLADLMTQYQNNLLGLEQQLNSGLSDLDTNRLNYSMQINSELQDILNNYADKITDYIYNNPGIGGIGAINYDQEGSKILDAYNNGNLGAALNGVPNDYINNLQNLAANSAYFSMNPAEAYNYYDPVSMQQAGQYVNSNYAKALAAQEALGATTPQARNTALTQYGNISSLQEILRQLGYM